MSGSTKRELHAGTRSCVGCGGRVAVSRARAELLRLVFVEGDDGVISVVPDLAGGATGRGAWVHARLDCLEGAVRKGLSRAARAPVSVELGELRRQLVAQADRRVAGLLGAAKRARKLAIGADPVREATRAGHVSMILAATDAAAAVRSPEVARAQAGGRAVAWGTKASVGAALGRGEVGVLAVSDAGIAQALRHAIGMAETFGSGNQSAN